jgi:hypothetical protein
MTNANKNNIIFFVASSQSQWDRYEYLSQYDKKNDTISLKCKCINTMFMTESEWTIIDNCPLYGHSPRYILSLTAKNLPKSTWVNSISFKEIEIV